MTKIIELRTENVKRIRAVELKALDTGLVIIGGDNGNGKTSLLDSIAMAINYAGTGIKEPLRKGAEKGVVRLVLDDLIIERTFTSKGSYLNVKNKDGFEASKPQELLNSLAGRISFDPLSFIGLDGKKQAIALRELVGLDFAELDENRKKIYAERRDQNAIVKAQKAVYESMIEAPENTPDTEVSVDALMADLEAAREKNRDKALDLNAIKTCQIDANDERLRFNQLEQERGERQSELEQLEIEYEKAVGETLAVIGKIKAEQLLSDKRSISIMNGIIEMQKAHEAMPDIDEEPFTIAISESQNVNRNVRAKQARISGKAKLEKLTVEAGKLTKKIDAIDAEKAKQLKAAKFPIDGLGFTSDGVTFNELPFEQASQAEQLRISTAMGLAMNPKLKVMLVRDGSSLDNKNMKLVADMAQEHDAQVWIERVGNNDETAVIIQDGAVKGAPQETEPETTKNDE